MYEPGTHAHVYTQTNVASTIYEHIHEYACYFQYHKFNGVYTSKYGRIGKHLHVDVRMHRC